MTYAALASIGSFVALSLCTVGWAQSRAPDAWFTIMGDLSNPRGDTVEINLHSLHLQGVKTMALRVNLAVARTMPNGEVFQSYTSTLAVECDQEAIVHLDQLRFRGPVWSGPSTFQAFPEARPMAFGGLSPSPKPKVLKAACTRNGSVAP